ncbi:hypothetical protein [Marinibacterium sp. SX1]|uniref:hypothetical protein n=1 Tax=Marinibacterium sp. SX1 TaxID=3388424 RepID=UPI003D185D17
MSDSLQDRKRVVTKVMVATFVGLHVPLTCLFLYALLTGFTGMGPVLWLALGATLLATGVTLFYIHSRLWPVKDGLTA